MSTEGFFDLDISIPMGMAVSVLFHSKFCSAQRLIPQTSWLQIQHVILFNISTLKRSICWRMDAVGIFNQGSTASLSVYPLCYICSTVALGIDVCKVISFSMWTRTNFPFLVVMWNLSDVIVKILFHSTTDILGTFLCKLIFSLGKQ